MPAVHQSERALQTSSTLNPHRFLMVTLNILTFSEHLGNGESSCRREFKGEGSFVMTLCFYSLEIYLKYELHTMYFKIFSEL